MTPLKDFTICLNFSKKKKKLKFNSNEKSFFKKKIKCIKITF